MKLKSDENLNPQLREEVQSVRAVINKGIESERFKKEPCDDEPAYIITDTKAQKQTVVPLYALADVMNVLVELFG